MADIFISYKKEDAGRVIRMVEALRAEGFDVWWDHASSRRAGCPNDKVMNCIADLAYSCRREMKVTERTEICG